MDNKKDNSYYLQKISSDLAFLISHTNGIDRSVLEDDEILLDSVMFRLIQISENSSKLTDDFKDLHADVPWRAIKGLRNRIVHDYGEVDLTVIFDTVSHDIPKLYEMISDILK